MQSYELLIIHYSQLNGMFCLCLEFKQQADKKLCNHAITVGQSLESCYSAKIYISKRGGGDNDLEIYISKSLSPYTLPTFSQKLTEYSE